jgi:hypothetical protein
MGVDKQQASRGTKKSPPSPSTQGEHVSVVPPEFPEQCSGPSNPGNGGFRRPLLGLMSVPAAAPGGLLRCSFDGFSPASRSLPPQQRYFFPSTLLNGSLVPFSAPKVKKNFCAPEERTPLTRVSGSVILSGQNKAGTVPHLLCTGAVVNSSFKPLHAVEGELLCGYRFRYPF